MRKSLFSKTWKQAVAAAFLALLLVVPAGAQGQGGITLKMRGNLEQVLDAVERQSRYLFLNDQVDLNRTVSVNVTDMPVAAALDEIFKGTGIQYRITETNIIISNRPISEERVRELTRTAPQQPKKTSRLRKKPLRSFMKSIGTLKRARQRKSTRIYCFGSINPKRHTTS